MESKGSLPCSQGPATGPYTKPDTSSIHLPTLYPWDPFLYYLLIYTCVFWVVSSFKFSDQNIVCISTCIVSGFRRWIVCVLPSDSHGDCFVSARASWKYGESFCSSHTEGFTSCSE